MYIYIYEATMWQWKPAVTSARIGHWTRALAFLELMRAAQARDRDETRVGDETTWSTPDPKK